MFSTAVQFGGYNWEASDLRKKFAHHTGHAYYELKRTAGRVTANYFRGVSTVLHLSIEKLR
jgi:hypothetical protein